MFLTLQANPKVVNKYFFPTGTKTHGQKLTKALSNPGQCSDLVNIEPINFNRVLMLKHTSLSLDSQNGFF